LGFASEGAEKDKDGKKNGWGESAFGILPEIGYSLSDKFDVGVTLGFGMENSNFWADDEKQGALRTTRFGIEPYVRYTFCEFGKFSLLGRAGFGFGLESDKMFDDEGKEIDGSKSSATTLGFTITPMVLYSLSDKVCLYTTLNFAGLGFESTTNKDNDGNKTNSQSNFGVGINTNNAFTTGAIQVGFVYVF